MDRNWTNRKSSMIGKQKWMQFRFQHMCNKSVLVSTDHISSMNIKKKSSNDWSQSSEASIKSISSMGSLECAINNIHAGSQIYATQKSSLMSNFALSVCHIKFVHRPIDQQIRIPKNFVKLYNAMAIAIAIRTHKRMAFIFYSSIGMNPAWSLYDCTCKYEHFSLSLLIVLEAPMSRHQRILTGTRSIHTHTYTLRTEHLQWCVCMVGVNVTAECALVLVCWGESPSFFVTIHVTIGKFARPYSSCMWTHTHTIVHTCTHTLTHSQQQTWCYRV